MHAADTIPALGQQCSRGLFPSRPALERVCSRATRPVIVVHVAVASLLPIALALTTTEEGRIRQVDTAAPAGRRTTRLRCPRRVVPVPVFGLPPAPAGRTRRAVLGCCSSAHNGRGSVRNEDALEIHGRALGQIVIVLHSQTRLLVVGCYRANGRGAACRATLAQGH